MGEERAREILEAAQEFDNPTPEEPEEGAEGAPEGTVLEEPAVEEKG
jgi:hypothetical protein